MHITAPWRPLNSLAHRSSALEGGDRLAVITKQSEKSVKLSTAPCIRTYLPMPIYGLSLLTNAMLPAVNNMPRDPSAPIAAPPLPKQFSLGRHCVAVFRDLLVFASLQCCNSPVSRVGGRGPLHNDPAATACLPAWEGGGRHTQNLRHTSKRLLSLEPNHHRQMPNSKTLHIVPRLS